MPDHDDHDDHDDTDTPTGDVGAYPGGDMVNMEVGPHKFAFTPDEARALACDLIWAATEIDLDSDAPANPVHLPRRRVTPPDVEAN